MSLLNQMGFRTLDTQEAFSDRDFIVGDGTQTLKIEAEKSNGWKEKDDIPGYWSYVSVPYRKRRSGADVYVICNKDMTAMAVCKMDEVKKAKVQEKYVYMTAMNEAFFFVPLEKFDVYYNEDNVWKSKRTNNNVLCK